MPAVSARAVGAEALKEATKLAPTDYATWNKLGATLANSSDAAEAQYAYAEAIKVRPKYIRGHVNMGMSYGAADRPDEAAKSYIKAGFDEALLSLCRPISLLYGESL